VDSRGGNVTIDDGKLQQSIDPFNGCVILAANSAVKLNALNKLISPVTPVNMLITN